MPKPAAQPQFGDAPSIATKSDVASQTARALFGIREMLLNGEFPPGDRISELPMVARLGMSRTPIRLALERLAHVGFLDVGPTGGFTVRGFTLAEVLDAIEIRGVLEGTAARLAAERLTQDAELAVLRRLGGEIEELGPLTVETFAQYMSLNDAFHSAIVDLSKSAVLRRNLEQFFSLPFASPSGMVFPTSAMPKADETLAIAHEHHRRIVEAIGNRQGTRAESLAREHAFIARRVLELTLSNYEGLQRVPGAALINMGGS